MGIAAERASRQSIPEPVPACTPPEAHLNAPTNIGRAASEYLAEPDNDVARKTLVAQLSSAPDAVANASVRRALDVLAGDDHLDHARLSTAAATAVTALPTVGRALERLTRGTNLSPGQYRAIAGALAAPLPSRLLSDYVFASADIERLLGALRQRWLVALVSDDSYPWPSDELMGAAALQMCTTEWIYDVTETEAQILHDFELPVSMVRFKDTPNPLVPLLIAAMYGPISNAADWSAFAMRTGGGRLSELVERIVVAHGDDGVPAASIPRLTAISDETSRAVRDQYESRPYPRWWRLPVRDRRPLGESVALALAMPDLADRIDIEAPRILIAGCGTGRHALMTAARYEGCEVLGVDLSITSLAYASSQAQRYGIGNVEFAQADIAELGHLDREFDVIECVGVLHHMADPEAGWAALRKLLAPHGLMKIGLYSTYGRRFVDPIVSRIRDHNLESDTDGVRRARQWVKRLADGDPARRLLGVPDFYSYSGCKDLFFHVHEDRFDLPRIQQALDALQLDFVGFELPSSRIRTIYQGMFAEEPTRRDLDNWQVMERRYPYLFAAMYRFWTTPRGTR